MKNLNLTVLIVLILAVLSGLVLASQKPRSPQEAPPPTGNQMTDWNIYRHDPYVFEIQYPKTATLKTGQDVSEGASWLNDGLVQIELPKQEGTNLSEAFVLVSATSNAQELASCDRAHTNIDEQIPDREIINDVEYYSDEFDGAAAGNFYATHLYRTIRNNTCYEINLLIHSTNFGNYEPGAVTEFDKAAVDKQLHAIFETFRFVD